MRICLRRPDQYLSQTLACADTPQRARAIRPCAATLPAVAEPSTLPYGVAALTHLKNPCNRVLDGTLRLSARWNCTCHSTTRSGMSGNLFERSPCELTENSVPRAPASVPGGSRAVVPFRTSSTTSHLRESSPAHTTSSSSLLLLAHAIVHADQRGSWAYLSQLCRLFLSWSPMPRCRAPGKDVRAETSACAPSNPTCPRTVSAGCAIRYVN